MNERKANPSDLTDEQWQQMRLLLPRTRGRGRTRRHNQRDLVNARADVRPTGGQWRALPPWQTGYGFFRKLCRERMWQTINGILRMGGRQHAGRKADPSMVIIDSQSVKTTEKGHPAATMVASKSKDANDRSSWR
jgi:transposase